MAGGGTGRGAGRGAGSGAGFTVATFNVQSLISPGRPFYGGAGLDAEAFGWKIEWLSDQLLALDADLVALQEVFDAEALDALVACTDAKGRARGPGAYGGTLWRGGAWRPYGAGRVFAPNLNAGPEHPRPGLAILSRPPITGGGSVQDISKRPLATHFMQLGAGSAGEWTLTRLSRPVQWVELEIDGRPVTLFNAHLKSPAGEFFDDPAATASSEGATEGARDGAAAGYDPVLRGIGLIRATLRRMGEALALRREIVAALEAGRAVIAAGDINSPHEGDAGRLLAGEAAAFVDPPEGADAAAAAALAARVEALRLDSAERVYARRVGREAFHSGAFGGIYESLDRLLLSAAFRDGAPGQLGRLAHLRAFNDHLNDGGLAPGAFDALASDHGQLVARIEWL